MHDISIEIAPYKYSIIDFRLSLGVVVHRTLGNTLLTVFTLNLNYIMMYLHYIIVKYLRLGVIPISHYCGSRHVWQLYNILDQYSI